MKKHKFPYQCVMIPCKHKFAVPARHGGCDGERRRGSEVDGGRGLVGKGPIGVDH